MSTTKRDQPVAVIEHDDARPDWALSDERLPVFAVRRRRVDENGEPILAVAEGEDAHELVTYSMPARPNPGIALRFLKRARTEGDLASAWLIEQAIGADGYDALAEALEDAAAQGIDAAGILQRVTEKIQRTLMGGLDAGPKA